MALFQYNLTYQANIRTSGKDRTIWVEEPRPFGIETVEFEAGDLVFSLSDVHGETVNWYSHDGLIMRPVLTNIGQIASEAEFAESKAPLVGVRPYEKAWVDHPLFKWRPWEYNEWHHTPGLTREAIETNAPILKKLTTETFKKWRSDNRQEAEHHAAEVLWSVRQNGDQIYRPAAEPLYVLEYSGESLNVRPWLSDEAYDDRVVYLFFRADERDLAIRTAELMVESGEDLQLEVDSRVIEIHGEHTPAEDIDVHWIRSLATRAHLDIRKNRVGDAEFGALSRYVEIRNCLEELDKGSDERIKMTVKTILGSSLDAADGHWIAARKMHTFSAMARELIEQHELDLEALDLPYA